MRRMNRCDTFATKKYFIDKLLSSDLSKNNVLIQRYKDTEILMIPTYTPKEHLIAIPSLRKIGLLYTKTVIFDSHVLDFIASLFNENSQHMVYVDGASLVDVLDKYMDYVHNTIRDFRMKAKYETECNMVNDLNSKAINIMKNGGKVNE